MQTQNWNNHEIRFVDVDGEYWAVAKDIADALDYAETRNLTKLVTKKFLMSSVLDGMNSKSTLISEFGIYKAIFNSKKKEAEEFQEWIFEVIKELRTQSGLEGYQVFRVLDKEHQKDMMQNLKRGVKEPKRQHFMKANTIANKAVSTMYGYDKMIKKSEMTPEMLVAREPILEDTVDLMSVKDKFDLPISVSSEVYKRVAV